MIIVLKNFYNDVVKKPQYWCVLSFFSIIAYGFFTFQRTVHIDDLATEIYVGSGKRMLAATRWGSLLWSKLLQLGSGSPFVSSFIAVCALLIAVVLMSAVFYSINQEKVINYTIFSVLFVTFPLISEIWSYSGTNTILGLNLMLVAAVVFYQNISCQKRWLVMVLSGATLSIVASSYEAPLFVYVTLVVMILFYKYCYLQQKMRYKWSWLLEGIQFAAPLFVAVSLRYIIGITLIKIYNLDYVANGATTIEWELTRTFVKKFLGDFLIKYVGNGLVYYPVTLFLVISILFFMIVVFMSIKQKRILPAILGVIIYFTLFFQAVLQGVVLPYRTSQTLSLFIAYTAFLLLHVREKKRYAILVVILTLLCYENSVFLHKVLALNNHRSDNEAAIIHQIGYRLKSEYDSKPVIFVGWYNEGDWIESQLIPDENSISGKLYVKWFGNKEYTETSIASILNWSMYGFEKQIMMEKHFAYYGYDIELVKDNFDKINAQAYKIASDKQLKSYDVLDQGSYLIVSIGSEGLFVSDK